MGFLQLTKDTKDSWDSSSFPKIPKILGIPRDLFLDFQCKFSSYCDPRLPKMAADLSLQRLSCSPCSCSAFPVFETALSIVTIGPHPSPLPLSFFIGRTFAELDGSCVQLIEWTLTIDWSVTSGQSANKVMVRVCVLLTNSFH